MSNDEKECYSIYSFELHPIAVSTDMFQYIDKHEFVSQFRPISSCNVVLEIISEVIVNKIKSLLDIIISSYQSSFIPNRIIHHNNIVVQELVHAMSKIKGEKGFLSIKIDLEKAYDHFN